MYLIPTCPRLLAGLPTPVPCNLLSGRMASEKFGQDRFDDIIASSDDNVDEPTWTEAEEKIVRNKLDWQIVRQTDG